MAQTNRSGCLFGPKSSRTRFQGILSKKGGLALERARSRLWALYREVFGIDPTRISDGDVVEYLARGDEDCRQELEAKARR